MTSGGTIFFLQTSTIPSSQHFRLHSFDFDDDQMSDEDTFKVSALHIVFFKWVLLLILDTFQYN